MKKKILVLGCTGSIGKSTLQIIREFPDCFSLCGLSAHSNIKMLKSFSEEFSCANTALSSSDKNSIKTLIEKSGADIAVNGIAGSAGLMPSVYCLQNGIDLALANKESIVMAGTLITDLAKKNKCRILPVDSEHSAVFTLIEKFGKNSLERIILTASGGPFRTFSNTDLEKVKPEQALRHPTWNMGKKITIDSATLANKGLEVIEACRLFDVPSEKVEVVIHPQSLVHSFIRTKDGDLYAQVSKPDMRRPILSALTWPRLWENSIEKLDIWAGISGKEQEGLKMDFYPPRFNDFPLLKLAYQAQNQGGAYTIAYNAANETAVNLFLQKKLNFTGIANLVKMTLNKDWKTEPITFDDIFFFDEQARKAAVQIAQGVIT